MGWWRRIDAKARRDVPTLAGAAAMAALLAGCGQDLPSGSGEMSFFITGERTGSGGDLNGLAAADLHCQTLAGRVDARKKEWRAYLSTAATGGQPAVNARDRIGRGPWSNARGFQVAASLDELHGDAANLTQQTALDERGRTVSGSNPRRADRLDRGRDVGGRGLDLRELDQYGRGGDGGPSQPPGRRRPAALVELRARLARLQPACAGVHRRRCPILLFRRGLKSRALRTSV